MDCADGSVGQTCHSFLGNADPQAFPEASHGSLSGGVWSGTQIIPVPPAISWLSSLKEAFVCDCALHTPFTQTLGLKGGPAGRVTKMAIIRSWGPKTRGIWDHWMLHFALFDFVCLQNLLKMHVAPGNRDLLPFRAVFALTTSPGRGRLGDQNGHNSV